MSDGTGRKSWPGRYDHIRRVAAIGTLRRSDRYAADKIEAAISKKKATEAALIELGLKSYRPLKTLVR